MNSVTFTYGNTVKTVLTGCSTRVNLEAFIFRQRHFMRDMIGEPFVGVVEIKATDSDGNVLGYGSTNFKGKRVSDSYTRLFFNLPEPNRKWKRVAVIQQYIRGCGWSDVTFYDQNSMQDMESLRHDIKSYRENEPGSYRVINRRTLNN